MSDTTIAGLFSWEALDSRGKPTVGCEIRLEGGSAGQATVPSGASTGRHEARELRDGGTRYGGFGARTAVGHVNGEIAAAVRGLDAADQPNLDDVLRRLDGTADLSRLGTNAVLAVSVAAAVAGARGRGVPLFTAVADEGAVPLLPLPTVNIISGGAHAGRSIDVQDFLAVPVGAGSFAQAMEWAARVRAGVADELMGRGLPVALVADEGGLGPVLHANRTALDVMVAGIARAGLRAGDDVAIAIDVAATQLLRRDGRYHIRVHFRGLFDGILLRELHVGHVEQAFRRLFDEGMTPATARRLFSTLRTALNAAARERLIGDNPARYIKLPRGARPHAVVWTKRRVQEWQQTGIRPAVAVWTPAQLAQFLSSIGSHRLFAVFHLIAMRGLRRGEACGLKWENLDLDEGLAYLSRQVQEGPDGRLRACPLKTESSRRAVALDPHTVTVLRAHRSWQARWLGEPGITTQGWVFTDEIGWPLSPDHLTRTFNALVNASGLPPVRLHDLRHGAATRSGG